MSRRTTGVVSLLALLGATATATAAPFEDRLVQAPTLRAPERGSLAGALSRTAFGPGDLARGTFGLPLPIAAPDVRGPLLARVIPGYSTEAGLGEWGMGWAADLSLRRFRLGGEVDVAVDEFTSPWGRLVAGDDGYYYPTGAAPMTRLSRTAAGGWLVETGDGIRYRFDPADAVTTPRGTYAWQLSRVDNLLGDSTTLTWTRNASGRPFLSAVRWGGRGDGTAYRMTFDYEAVPTPWVSFAPGVAHVLDKRVRQINVAVKNGAAYTTRWSYTLGYQASPTGPAFYLTSVQRTMASGQREPALRYDYDLGGEHRAAVAFQPIAALDSVFATYGAAAILPSQSAGVDLEQNGLSDLELAYDFTTLRQQAAGFAVEALPPATGVSVLCRPRPSVLNSPRHLARMHGAAVEAQVVVTLPMWLTTMVTVCDRSGVIVGSSLAAGEWDLGANRRLADVDGDHRPDLVAAYAGLVQVLPNSAASATAVGFAPQVATTLSPVVTPDASWVMDHNGDGRADLLVRAGNDLLVWRGLGQHRFESTATYYALIVAGGGALTELGSYELSHGDFNNDGLADVVASKNGSAILFTHRGTQYVETAVPALVNLPYDASFPLVADLAGTGNDAIVVVAGGRARSLDLTTASTGLLRSADDGMGTVLSFAYERTAPWPGAVRRYATLRALTVASSGYDPVTYQYAYGAPVPHSVGKFLVGYASASKQSPFLTETHAFANDDDVSAVVLDTTALDARTPGIVKFSHHAYDDVQLHGVRWLRPRESAQGLRSSDGAITHAVTTRMLAHARGGCATTVETVGSSGTLTETTTLASIAQIPDALHCLAATSAITGSHADPARNFTYALDATRDDRGQVTKLTQRAPDGATLVLQELTYRADHRLAAITTPGRGTQQYDYDSAGRLASTVDPVGVAQQITAYDPVTEAIRTLRSGTATHAATFSYRYDGRERLTSLWDDQSGTSEADPSSTFSYRDPTSLRPGRVDAMVRADLGQARTRTVQLVAADGETLTTGRWMNDLDGYAMSDVPVTDRALGRVRTQRLGRMSAGTLANLTSDQLRAAGVPLHVDVSTGFGEPQTQTRTHEFGVVGTTSYQRTLTSEGLALSTTTPDGAVQSVVTDAADNVVRTTDGLGVSQTAAYDALGRLVALAMPDGTYAVTFDGFGRAAEVHRAGFGTIEFVYDAVSGLPTTTTRRTEAGELVQRAVTSYDAAGRVSRVEQSNGAASSVVRYAYDGVRDPAQPPLPGQTGQLTRIAGDGWTKTSTFDLLGRPTRDEIEIAGWRRLETTRGYHLSGSIAWETRAIYDAAGALLFSSNRTLALDAAGRVSEVSVDGAPIYHLVYDVEGELSQIGVDASGDLIEFSTDPSTGERTGYHLETSRGDDGVRWRHNARGQVAREVYSRDGVDTVRSYQYSPRDQLVASTTGTDEIRYSYGDAGNPTQVVDSAGARDLARNGADLTVGSVEYHWDAAGRVDRKGPWMLAYGASGQLEVATRIGRVVQFSYDEEGERLLKRIDGTPVRANLGGGVLTADRFVEPVVVEGVVIGVLENGAFSSLLTDPRGTVVVDKNGARTLASPYGLRTVRPDVTEVVDFTKLGWDPDLDVVRMGVRDYDPNLAQFHTPDPAFLGDPDRCLASALECNLYSYAAGNPIAFTDPSGLGVRSWARKAASATWGAAQAVGQAVVDYGPQIAGAAVGAVVGCATAGPAGCVVGTRYGMVIGGALGAGFGYAAKSLVTGDGDVTGTIHAMTWGAASEMGAAIVGRVVGAVAAPAFRRLADWWAKQRASMDNLRSLMNVSMAGGPSGRPKIKVGRGAVTAPTAQPSKPMLGARGVQVTSKTMWQGERGARIDLENPNPGQRAGQIHFQRHGDDIKYLYDPSSNRFFGAPEAVNDLLERPDVKKAIEKAMRYLGEST